MRHYDDAVRFYQEGRYDAARIEFEASFALSKEPDLLYNLSTTAEKQGQLADAIRYAERYLEAKPDAEDGTRVRQRIASLRAKQQPTPTQEPSRPPETTPNLITQPTPNTAPEPKDSSGKAGLPKPALVLLGGGAGLLLAGIGTGAGALVTEKQIAGSDMFYLRDLQDLQDRGRALNTAAIVLSVAGGAAVAAGAGWLIAWKVKSRQTP